MKKAIHFLIQYGFLCCYFIVALVLIIEACMPGNVSGEQSNQVGDKISDIIDNNTKEDTKYIDPTKVEILMGEEDIYPKDKIEISTKVYPENASNQAIVWKVDHEEIAKIKQDGTLEALLPGTIMITATIKDTEISTTKQIKIKERFATSIEITNDISTIYLSETYILSTKIYPENTTNQVVWWESSNQDIATIESDGTILAHQEGTVTFTVYTTNGLSDTITVTVLEVPTIDVEKIEVLSNWDSLYIGEKRKLHVQVFPNNATNPLLTYYIENEEDKNKIKIDNKGNVLALQEGVVTVLIRSIQNPTIEKEVTITIKAYPELEDFDATVPEQMIVGTTSKIEITHPFPSNGNLQHLVFSSDNENIVVVQKDGLIIAKSQGHATITISSSFIEKKYEVEVREENVILVEKIEVENIQLLSSCYIGQSFRLVYAIFPQDATDQGITIRSSDDEVVGIKNQTLICKKNGVVNINVISNMNPDVFCTFEMEVKEVRISQITYIEEETEITEYNLPLGESYQLQVALESMVVGLDITDDLLVWSSNSACVIVNEDGRIVGVKKGAATITVKAAHYPEVFASIQINVYEIYMESIQLLLEQTPFEKIELQEGKTISLEAHIYPLNTTNKTLKWTIKDSSIAKVNEKGELVAIQNGTTALVVSSLSNPEVVIEKEIVVKNRPAIFTVLNQLNEEHCLSIKAGTSVRLKLNKSSMPSNYQITYMVSNPKCISVSEDGTILAHQSGKATIRIICISGDGTKKEIQLEVVVIRQSIADKIASFQLLIRKGIGHFGAFLVFAILAGAVSLFFFKKQWFWLCISLVSGFIIAGITELIQLYIPGRAGLFSDVWIDYTGYIIGTLLVFGTYYIVYFVKYIRKKGVTQMIYQDKYHQILNSHQYVGVNTLLVNSSKTYLSSHGYQDIENNIALSEDTIFRIASISKVIVALGAMKLYEEHQLQITEDISQYLGFTVRNPFYPNIPITIEMLMTQTSSIQDGADEEKGYDGVNGKDVEVNLEDLLTNPNCPYFLSTTFRNVKPGTHWEYSNFGCGILACIIEKVSGMYFSDYIREKILLPLHMDASFRISDIIHKNKVASLYEYNTKTSTFVLQRDKDLFLKYEYPKYSLGNNYRMAAGGLFVSMLDLKKIMVMMMNKGTYQNQKIFDSSTIEYMQEVHWQGESGDSLYKKKGLQLIILDNYSKEPLYGHFGNAYGLRSFMLFNDKKGLIFMCNGARFVYNNKGITTLQDETIRYMLSYNEK